MQLVRAHPYLSEFVREPAHRRLRAVESMLLDINLLSGPGLAELGQLSALKCLYLYSNALTGPIPAELAQLSALKMCILHSNKLTGPIPIPVLELGAGALALADLDLHAAQRALRAGAGAV